MDSALTRPQLVRWRAAIFAVFLVSGLSVATWAARVPDIKLALDIDKSQVGMLLLGAGIASIIGISSSPAVMARTGARLGMLTSMVTFAAGVALIGIGANVLESFPVVLVGLVLFGLGNGVVDVISLAIVAVAIAAIANVPSRDETLDPVDAGTDRAPWRERMHMALSAWREPRTYALGVVMLGMSFAEGGANDWLALGVVEGHGQSAALGAAALAAFSVAMTAVRIFGGPLVDRFGRVLVLRILAVTAAAGILLFILAPNVPLVFLGAVLWGVGASLGFPLGMSAAADDPAKAAARVSAAATIGYIAFLGFISEHIGLLNSLYILVALIVASGFFSGAARPLRADEKTPTA